MFETLEPFSKEMAKDLLSVFPDWGGYFSIVSNGGENFFSFKIPQPLGAKGGPLEVASLEDEDIIVCYSGSHWHRFSVLGVEHEPEGAAEFVKKIISEELVIVSYLCFGDSLIPDGVFANSLVPAGKIPRANYEYYYATQMSVRSWLGTYDSDFSAPYIASKPTQSL